MRFFADNSDYRREMQRAPKSDSRLDIGSRVAIGGEHPHAGRVGKIEGIYSFQHGIGNAIKVEFEDGDSCFVFQKDAGKVRLIPIE